MITKNHDNVKKLRKIQSDLLGWYSFLKENYNINRIMNTISYNLPAKSYSSDGYNSDEERQLKVKLRTVGFTDISRLFENLNTIECELVEFSNVIYDVIKLIREQFYLIQTIKREIELEKENKNEQ